MNSFDLPIGIQELRAYEARPLDGVWATPSFLHNGSVPGLLQLLSPTTERSPQFYVGTFEFDPKFVGFHTKKFPGGFLLDIHLTGNRSSGYEFRSGRRQNGMIGRALSPEGRWALVEYLKVLGDPEFERRLVPTQTPPWTLGPKYPMPEQRIAQRWTWEMEKHKAWRRRPSPPRAAPLPSEGVPSQRTGRSNRGAPPAQEE